MDYINFYFKNKKSTMVAKKDQAALQDFDEEKKMVQESQISGNS